MYNYFNLDLKIKYYNIRKYKMTYYSIYVKKLDKLIRNSRNKLLGKSSFSLKRDVPVPAPKLFDKYIEARKDKFLSALEDSKEDPYKIKYTYDKIVNQIIAHKWYLCNKEKKLGIKK